MLRILEMTKKNEIMEEFDLSLVAQKKSSYERKSITVWLEPEYVSRYEELQRLSGKEFSKHLRRLVMRAIERVKDSKAG